MGDSDSLYPYMVEKYKQLLLDHGTELLKPCDSTEELMRKLDRFEIVLSCIYQDMKKSVELALQPSKKALIANEFIRHAELEVRVSVASCISEIFRISVPDAPYDHGHMKEFFQVANSAFECLPCMSGRAYSKALSILGTLSQSCVVMSEFQFFDIIRQMFSLFLNGIRATHSSTIFSSMEKIMTVIIQSNKNNKESSLELAKTLLYRLTKENKNVSPVAFQLAENTFKNCSNGLKTYIPEAVQRLGIPVEDYSEVVTSLFQRATQRENMVSIEIGSNASCQLEADLAFDGGLLNIAEGTNTNNEKPDGNVNEDQSKANQPENLSSLKQHALKPIDIPIRGKRTRKPSSYIKPNEGYDARWLWSEETSLNDPNPSKKVISRKFRHEGESSNAHISQKANRLKKGSVKLQGSLETKSHEKSSCGTIVLDDLRGEKTVEDLGKTQESSTAPTKKFCEKAIIPQDLRDDITIKQSAIQSRPLSLKRKVLSEEASNPLPKRKSATTENKASKFRYTSRIPGEDLIGCRIKVWWRRDKKFHKGKVSHFDPSNKVHMVDYDVGVIEILNLQGECWKLLGDDNSSPQQEQNAVKTLGASKENENASGEKDVSECQKPDQRNQTSD